MTSVICYPPHHTVITDTPDFVEVKGVAHSFGRSGSNRVDVSIDGGGKNWTCAGMYKPEDLLKKVRYQQLWSWYLFSHQVPLNPKANRERMKQVLQL